MHGLTNIMRREAEKAMGRRAATRMGIVSSYDPSHYAAKVIIQPEGIETGFLPIATEWAGNGWGDYNPPSPGDMVDVHFQEGGKLAPYISRRFYGAVLQPLAVPSGESWRVHKSGSFLKFHNDGTIEINAATAVNATAPAFNLTGDLNVTGNIKASGDIADLNDGSNTLNYIRTVFDLHTHSGVESGGGNTGITNQPL